MEYLNSFNLFSVYQYSLQTSKSTEATLLNFTNKVYSGVNENKKIDRPICQFQKGF